MRSRDNVPESPSILIPVWLIMRSFLHGRRWADYSAGDDPDACNAASAEHNRHHHDSRHQHKRCRKKSLTAVNSKDMRPGSIKGWICNSVRTPRYRARFARMDASAAASFERTHPRCSEACPGFNMSFDDSSAELVCPLMLADMAAACCAWSRISMRSD